MSHRVTAQPVAAQQPIAARQFQDDDDFMRVRSLLIETYPITPADFNWDTRRWEGSRFYNADPALNPRWRDDVRLWETSEGRLVGVTHAEGRGDACLQIHPHYRPLIEEEMIAWAEDHLAVLTEDGQQRQITVFAYDYDAQRLQLLVARGYEEQPYGGVIRHMRFGKKPVPPPELAAGYTLRCTRPGADDCQRIADLVNAAFRRTFHNAGEYHTFSTLSPSFRHDLHLVAEAPDGSFAAHIGLTYDEVNRYGLFEPVCTHPDHVRKGLARALMLEGLRRIRVLGAVEARVGSGDPVNAQAANRLYHAIGEAAGFVETYEGRYWRKTF